jgi:hypothetical protein
MRSFVIGLSVALGVGCYSGSLVHAQGYPPGYHPGTQMPPHATNAPPPASQYSGGSAATSENCGTPDEPKPCPPLPRHPLPYYPANRQ